MSAVPWLLGGGAAVTVGAVLWHRGRSSLERSSLRLRTEVSPEAAVVPGQWAWPVGIWQSRKPEISDGFGGKRRSPTSGEVIAHGGVDIMYRRVAGDSWPAGTTNASPHYVMPSHRAALAVSDGVVTFAAYTPRGWTVILDHSLHGIETYCTHMSRLLVIPNQIVRAGQPLGIIGADPLDKAHLMHLHFGLRRSRSKEWIDPERAMKTWSYVADPGDLPQGLLAKAPLSPGEAVTAKEPANWA